MPTTRPAVGVGELGAFVEVHGGTIDPFAGSFEVPLPNDGLGDWELWLFHHDDFTPHPDSVDRGRLLDRYAFTIAGSMPTGELRLGQSVLEAKGVLRFETRCEGCSDTAFVGFVYVEDGHPSPPYARAYAKTRLEPGRSTYEVEARALGMAGEYRARLFDRDTSVEGLEPLVLAEQRLELRPSSSVPSSGGGSVNEHELSASARSFERHTADAITRLIEVRERVAAGVGAFRDAIRAVQRGESEASVEQLFGEAADHGTEAETSGALLSQSVLVAHGIWERESVCPDLRGDMVNALDEAEDISDIAAQFGAALRGPFGPNHSRVVEGSGQQTLDALVRFAEAVNAPFQEREACLP